MPDASVFSVGPPATGDTSEHVRHQTTEKDPRKGSPLSARMGGAMEKNWPKRPTDPNYKRMEENSGRAVVPAAEAVCVSAHLVPQGSPQAKKLHHLHVPLTLGKSCYR